MCETASCLIWILKITEEYHLPPRIFFINEHVKMPSSLAVTLRAPWYLIWILRSFVIERKLHKQFNLSGWIVNFSLAKSWRALVEVVACFYSVHLLLDSSRTFAKAELWFKINRLQMYRVQILIDKVPSFQHLYIITVQI